jgi:crotonobetainyl-CoA:carnitine CoA-transferase CaiB-like acyl-CoA transferase
MNSTQPTPTQTRLQSSALGGLRVIDFTHFIAGPMATMILADAGADVIKIEKPRGDDQRYFAPSEASLDGQGASFLWANRNKRSVTLDLKTDAGRAIAQALVRDADVVVENFTSRVMAQYGLDYETLARDNPASSIVRSRPSVAQANWPIAPASTPSCRPRAASCRSPATPTATACAPARR